MIIRLKFRNNMYVFKVSLKKYKIPNSSTVGLINRTKDGYYLLFIDYDEVKKSVVFEDVDFYQNQMGLGTAVVMKSSEVMEDSGVYGSYHVVFFEKFKFDRVRELLSYARCDDSYRHGWKWHNRSWVLRIAPKLSLDDGSEGKPCPILIATLPHTSSTVSSRGHIEFYNKVFDAKIPVPNNSDSTLYNDVDIMTYGATL